MLRVVGAEEALEHHATTGIVPSQSQHNEIAHPVDGQNGDHGEEDQLAVEDLPEIGLINVVKEENGQKDLEYQPIHGVESGFFCKSQPFEKIAQRHQEEDGHHGFKR